MERISDQRSAISDQRSAISDQRSAIRGVAARSLVLALVACVATALASRTALAQDTQVTTKGPICPLPYSPYTHETATPHAAYDDSENPGDYRYLCSLDEDHDGLDDNIENIVAQCFAPYLKFDKAENARRAYSTLPLGSKPPSTEPLGLYSLNPTDNHDRTADLHWLLVFDRDGGFASYLSPAEPTKAKDAHPGDTQPMYGRVQFEQDPSTKEWTAHLIEWKPGDVRWVEGTAGTSSQLACHSYGQVGTIIATLLTGTNVTAEKCTGNTDPSARLANIEVHGTHPVVYLSAGKHHTYAHQQGGYSWNRVTEKPLIGPTITLFDEYDQAYGDGYSYVLPTRMNGNPGKALNIGRITVNSSVPLSAKVAACRDATDLDNVLAFECSCVGSSCPPPAPQDACNAATQQRDADWAVCYGSGGTATASNRNICRKEYEGLDAPADFVSDDDFKTFGYGGSLSDTRPFCGHLTPGCATEATAPATFLTWKPPALIDEDQDGVDNFHDTCPLVKQNNPMEQDAAQDGFGPDCDPENTLPHPNEYVHGYDRWVGRGSALRNLHAFVPDYQHNYPQLAGMLDSDGDGKINGYDFCPFTAAGTVNTNQGGEDLAFPPDGKGLYAHYGYEHRGNACDPFESTFVHPLFPFSDTLLFDVDCYNADTNHLWFDTTSPVQVDYAAVKGLSANDPALHPNPDTYANRAKVLLDKSETVPVTLERCACKLPNSPGWSTCAHDPASPCWVDQGLNGQVPELPTKEESGWHPLGPSDCQEDSDGYCLPISAHASPTIPRDCDPYKGQCAWPPPDWISWEIWPLSESWDWEAERTKHPDHLPKDLFEDLARFAGDPHAPADPLIATDGATYQRSRYPFLFGSEVAREASLDPSSKFYFPRTNQAPYFEPREYGQEPDVDISNQVAGQQLEARRLRSYFALWGDRPEDNPYLSGAHRVELQPLPPLCQHVWDQFDIHQALVNIVWPPDVEGWRMLATSPISVVSQPRGFALIASHPGVAPVADVLELSTGQTFPIVVTAVDYGAPTTGLSAMAAIGTSTDLARLLAGAPGGADVVPLATRKDGSSALPELLVVLYADATSSFPGNWFKLEPQGIDPGAGASYALRGVGQLPADFGKGVLRADTIPGAAVEFVEPGVDRRAGLWRFDAGQWSETPLPADLPARQHAAYLMHNAVLFRAGGADSDGNLVGDTLALETRSGREYDKTPTWVPRSDPALAWDQERGGLVYGGGFDASGAAHSDLWDAGLPGIAPELMLPDASGPDAPQLEASSLVLAGAESRQAVVLGTSRVEDAIASAWRGAVDGWHPQSLLSLRVGTGMDRCSDGSTPRLCADGASDWWGEPGHMACTPSAAGTCTSASQPALVKAQELPVQQARSADLDVMTTWVGADTHVEDWSDSDPPVLRGRIGVRAPVISVRADQGTVAVATRRGLVIVSQSDGQLHASDPLPLCGRPLAAEPLHDGRWVVSTSAGVALVSVDYTGTPSIAEAALLLPDNGGWSAYYVSPAECASHAVCRAADDIVCAGGRCGDGRARAPLALVGDRVALAPALGSTGGWLHGAGVKPATYGDLDHPPVLLLGHDGDGFHVLSEAHVDGTVQALRASGAWVYAVTEQQNGKHVQQFGPALGITDDEFTTAETHDVPWWVERRDMPDRRLRVVSGGVEIAEIAP